MILSDTAIKCGELYIPYRSLSDALGRHVRALIFENDDPNFLYSRSGSCSLLRYNDARYCFITKHQCRSFDLNNAKIVRSHIGGEVFSLDARWDVTPENEEEYEDICALRIADGSTSGLGLFDFYSTQGSATKINLSKLLIAVGCPTAMSEINYEPNSVHVTTVTIAARYKSASRNARHLHSIELLSNDTSPDFSKFDLDGLSGGSIFSLDGELGSYECNFRGIIIRGGNGLIHYVDSEFIGLMINKSLLS